MLEEWQQSSVMLNPSSEVTIHAGDEIIVVADDDDSYRANLDNLKKKKSNSVLALKKPLSPGFEQKNIRS